MNPVKERGSAVSVFLTTVLLASYQAAFSHQDSRGLMTAPWLTLHRFSVKGQVNKLEHATHPANL